MSGNKESVIEVLHELSAEWSAGTAGRWENVTIAAYLDAMAAWLQRFEQAYVNTGRPVPSDG
ncbi:MAG TPA: hypothetical protein VMA72_17050 [Streptosporangiaceae bacterium]|nr:hypothetical protein [Streptosporangiaceae bacterium]